MNKKCLIEEKELEYIVILRQNLQYFWLDTYTIFPTLISVIPEIKSVPTLFLPSGYSYFVCIGILQSCCIFCLLIVFLSFACLIIYVFHFDFRIDVVIITDIQLIQFHSKIRCTLTCSYLLVYLKTFYFLMVHLAFYLFLIPLICFTQQ